MYKMRLKATCSGAFHSCAGLAHAYHVHYLACKRTLFQQCLQVLAVKRRIDDLREFCTYFGLIAIADSFYDQVTQGAIIEEDLAKPIKNLATQSIAFLLQLLEQR